MFDDFSRAVSLRRNWPTILLAGALFFIGALLLEAIGWKNGVTLTLLILAAGFGAAAIRPIELAR